MTVVQTYVENQAKVSLSRRIATYISSMNLAKIFRRHHHHHQHTRESTSPVRKPLERSSVNHDHHRYNRPFSYHIPKTEQSSTKVINIIPYRIGLSSDSTLVNNTSAHDNDEIIRLPMKNGKDYKNRRYSSQLNANKRWLFRSMETLDGWKGKVFAHKVRTISNSSQSRSRSVGNLADKNSNENMLANSNGSKIKRQRAPSPNRSIETITNRVMHSMGIHRKSAASIPNITRSPALTIQKQSSSTHFLNGHYPTQRQSNNEMNPSAILDFREISSLGFSQSRSPLTNDQENMSLSPSEDNPNHMNSDRDENDDITSDLSFIVNGHDNNGIDGTHDPWDFSISWIDSLKEQQSPHRKIQFYENLIKLLEQDTLNIDELLVLRKILAKIWPTDESTSTAASDFNNPINCLDTKISGTKSLHAPNQIKRRSKLSTLTHHTAQRCSTILEKSPLVYETLHEQKSGHKNIPASLLVAAKAKPCVIENNASSNPSSSNLDPSYPQHLNPFHDETDVTLPDSSKETSQHNHESIRRYFERLTLLETIYEKLNIESNRTSANPEISKSENTTQNRYSFEKHKEEMIDHSYPSVSSDKPHTNKTIPSRIFEMNVDGNGSISSRKSSIKRRAPTAPHISQNNEHLSKTPTMFTLSSADVTDATSKLSQETIIPIQIQSHKDKNSNQISLTERVSSPAYNLAASCDDDGHIFVYDITPTQTLKHSNDEQPSATSPKRAERIQEWLSTCDTREQSDRQHDVSPTTQVKIRCTAKSIHHRSPSPPRYHESNHFPLNNDEVEPGRFRTSLKIHLETNELTHPPTCTASATSKLYPRSSSTLMEESDTNDYQYLERNTLSPSFLRDHQAVYL